MASSTARSGCLGGVRRVAPVGMHFANWVREPRGRRGQRCWGAFGVAVEIAAFTHGHPTGN